jgi:hypothetical protein
MSVPAFIPNWTIGACSFNTPDVTIGMVKSIQRFHKDMPFVIMENSTDDKTEELLQQIPQVQFYKAPGTNSPGSVDTLIGKCLTRYLLIVHTDIILLQPIHELLQAFEQSQAIIGGHVTGDRGGYLLHPLIDPWFFLLDLKILKQYNLVFYDPSRLSDPHKSNIQKDRLWDVGSSLYADVIENSLGVFPIPIDNYVKHYEGMSWQLASYDPDSPQDTPGFVNMRHKNSFLRDRGDFVKLQWEQAVRRLGILR